MYCHTICEPIVIDIIILYNIFVHNYEVREFVMETVSISQLRSNLLSYLKKAKDGHEIVVTSHGKSLATIIPPYNQNQEARKRLNQLAKSAVIGDVVSPSEEPWDVLS